MKNLTFHELLQQLFWMCLIQHLYERYLALKTNTKVIFKLIEDQKIQFISLKGLDQEVIMHYPNKLRIMDDQLYVLTNDYQDDLNIVLSNAYYQYLITKSEYEELLKNHQLQEVKADSMNFDSFLLDEHQKYYEILKLRKTWYQQLCFKHNDIMKQYANKDLSIDHGFIIYNQKMQMIWNDRGFVDHDVHQYEAFYYHVLHRFNKFHSLKQECLYDHPYIKETMLQYMKDNPIIHLFVVCALNKENLSDILGYDFSDLNYYYVLNGLLNDIDDEIWRIKEQINCVKCLFERLVFHYYIKANDPLKNNIDYETTSFEVVQIVDQFHIGSVYDIYLTLKDENKRNHYYQQLKPYEIVFFDLIYDFFSNKSKVIRVTPYNEMLYDFMIEHGLKTIDEVENYPERDCYDYFEVWLEFDRKLLMGK